jgi:hypothetical protein
MKKKFIVLASILLVLCLIVGFTNKEPVQEKQLGEYQGKLGPCEVYWYQGALIYICPEGKSVSAVR